RRVAADLEGVDFVLLPAAAVSGRVVDPAGAPVGGARLLATRAEGFFLGETPKVEATSDAEGAFTLPCPSPGELLLVVSARGYATQVTADVRAPAENVTVTLDRGFALRLETVIEEPERRPAPGVKVFAAWGDSFVTGETDARGRLELPHLSARESRGDGERTLFLSGPRYVSKQHDLASVVARDGVVDAGTIVMERGGVVRGFVRSSEGGVPVAGASVRPSGGPEEMETAFLGGSETLSRPDGAYELWGVPLNATGVTASHADYVAENRFNFLALAMGSSGEPIFSSGAREARRDIVLTPAATIRGIVLGPDGKPAPGARVNSTDAMAMFTRMFSGSSIGTHADHEGRFVWGQLRKDEKVDLEATHPDYGPSDRVSARAGDPAEAVLRLKPPHTVTGRVVDEAGKAVAGVRVAVLGQREGGSMTFTVKFEDLSASEGGAAVHGVSD
ncbi:MAG: carboxypeptidase-like regulatory domain-containing protein, partial [Planctomycetota bacterium]